MPRHGTDGGFRVVRRNRQGDVAVISRALGNEARVVARAPFEVLEVETEIVETVGNALKDRVSRDLRQLLVKTRIENAKADRIVLYGVVRGDYPFKGCNVRLARLARRAPHDFDLDHQAAVER